MLISLSHIYFYFVINLAIGLSKGRQDRHYGAKIGPYFNTLKERKAGVGNTAWLHPYGNRAGDHYSHMGDRGCTEIYAVSLQMRIFQNNQRLIGQNAYLDDILI